MIQDNYDSEEDYEAAKAYWGAELFQMLEEIGQKKQEIKPIRNCWCGTCQGSY